MAPLLVLAVMAALGLAPMSLLVARHPALMTRVLVGVLALLMPFPVVLSLLASLTTSTLLIVVVPVSGILPVTVLGGLLLPFVSPLDVVFLAAS